MYTKKIKFLSVVMGMLAALAITLFGYNVKDIFAKSNIVADCGTVVIPSNQEVNTILNKETGLITASWYDSEKAEEIQITFDSKDKKCSSSAKHIKEHAINEDKINQEQICNSIKNLIKQENPKVRGKKVNIDAAKKYISEWCD